MIDLMRCLRTVRPASRNITAFSQALNRQLRKTRSVHVTRHNSRRQRAVPSPSLDERTLNVAADRPD
ncbi:hypothetical protein TNCV_3722021 [Trichonephila clavipes]|nr:hypothetical protein TNCV_3722021 [Trichonephila clavipes]